MPSKRPGVRLTCPPIPLGFSFLRFAGCLRLDPHSGYLLPLIVRSLGTVSGVRSAIASTGIDGCA